MKKGDFLWSAYRITEKQKAGKARNIKEKQLKNSRNTVSKQLVAHRSSQRDNKNQISENNKTLENVYFQGSFVIEAKKTGEVFMADRYSKDKDYKVVTVIILTAYRGKEDRSYQLEASIGIYTDRIQSNSLDVFIKKADALMYQNKLQHKNCRKDE